MRTLLLLAALAAPVVLAPPARAEGDEAELPRVSVTELETPDDALTPAELATLTDSLRGATRKELAGRYLVQTREAKVAPQFVVTGKARKLGARKVLSLEAYEVKAHRLLGSDQLKGTKAEELHDELEKRARTLVRAWFDPGPAAAPPAVVVASAPDASAAAPQPADVPPAPVVGIPLSTSALSDKGTAATRAGDYGQAIELFRAALERDPPSPLRCKVLRNLAVTYTRAGKRAEAVETYRAALACDPETPERGKIEQAIEALQ
jgi:tetratricopeptide (TPR) repeat protein